MLCRDRFTAKYTGSGKNQQSGRSLEPISSAEPGLQDEHHQHQADSRGDAVEIRCPSQLVPYVRARRPSPADRSPDRHNRHRARRPGRASS